MINTGNSLLNCIIGGSILSLASCLNLLFKGNINGISYYFWNCLKFKDFELNICFILGLICCSSFCRQIYPESNDIAFDINTEMYSKGLSIIGFAISGFFIGFGTKMSNNCVLGHCILELPFLTKRSIFASISLIGCSIIIATFRSYFPFLEKDFFDKILFNIDLGIIPFCCFLGSLIILGIYLIIYISKKDWNKIKDLCYFFFIGIVFSYGFLQSGLIKRNMIIDFLTININWNPKMAFVLAVAIGLNFLLFKLIIKQFQNPILSNRFDIPSGKSYDLKLIIGAGILGLGWGFGGICPGTGIIASCVFIPQALIFVFFMALGQFCEALSDDFLEKHLGKSLYEKFSDEVLN